MGDYSSEEEEEHEWEEEEEEEDYGDEPLAPLVGLVDRLREEVTELQGGLEALQAHCEALGEELEAKRRRLKLAEAIMDLVHRQEEEKEGGGDDDDDDEEEDEGPGGGGAWRAEDEENVPQSSQASVRYEKGPLKRLCP
jgi:hypothetical protein